MQVDKFSEGPATDTDDSSADPDQSAADAGESVANAAAEGQTDETVSMRWQLWAIFIVSAAGLLLEVSYTRIVSYKLWYYYTYLVIGLALLGIGTGATFVVVSPRIRGAATRTILGWTSILGALSVVIGYAVVSQWPIDTAVLWDYGSRDSFANFGALLIICVALFITFVSIGVLIATLLGRGGKSLSKLYFADLVGAGLAAAVVVYLISWITPPGVIALSALLLAGLGAAAAYLKVGSQQESAAGSDTPAPTLGQVSTTERVAAVAVAAVCLAMLVFNSSLPDVKVEKHKISPPAEGFDASDWGPVFRVDVDPLPQEYNSKLLSHDGSWGSALHEWDGNTENLTEFENDPRAWPFAVLGEPARRELIIGSAGGNEIQTSLFFETEQIEAVELNPVTVDLVSEQFADYTGNLAENQAVNLTQGDGRTFLARSAEDFDLIWFVAPDSYAANNAASAGAFVLSESYLYTAQMIEESLGHLSEDGLVVAQFGEVDFANKPNRALRYVNTAREALEEMGVDDPSQHIAVARSSDPLSGGLSTFIVKRTPFTPDEVNRLVEVIPNVEPAELIYAPGIESSDSLVAQVAALGPGTSSETLLADYPYEVGAITDDGPFFWHFTPFTDVISEINQPASAVDLEDSIGERVLLLLLGIAAFFAALFLLLPFVMIRKEWKQLPAKGLSAVYFAALGLGFMLFEITMIQRFTQYLGYPTYSLTVTLATILVFTGIGAWLSGWLTNNKGVRPAKLMAVLLGVLAVLTVAYRFGVPALTENTLDAPFWMRVALTVIVLAPLGLCLGMFMPLGLSTVAGMSDHADEYVAWGWAINGAFSVVGSVLTTMLSMSFGFRTVQFMALLVYVAAGGVFVVLRKRARALSASAA